jgi:hypothetical protein
MPASNFEHCLNACLEFRKHGNFLVAALTGTGEATDGGTEAFTLLGLLTHHGRTGSAAAEELAAPSSPLIHSSNGTAAASARAAALE